MESNCTKYSVGSRQCSIQIANNGLEANETIASSAPIDIVLLGMGIQMSVMNGIDATIKIRENEGEGSRLPIIAMTGAAMGIDRTDLIKSGMDDVIAKPFTLEGLYQGRITWVKSTD